MKRIFVLMMMALMSAVMVNAKTVRGYVSDKNGNPVKELTIEPAKYDLSIAGTQVDTRNAADVLGNGRFAYDAATQSFDRSFASNLDWRKWIELAGTDGAFTYIPKCLMAHRIDAGTTTSGLIQSHGRYDEDLRIFTGLWGRTIARLLMCFYTRSYKMADAGRK